MFGFSFYWNDMDVDMSNFWYIAVDCSDSGAFDSSDPTIGLNRCNLEHFRFVIRSEIFIQETRITLISVHLFLLMALLLSAVLKSAAFNVSLNIQFDFIHNNTLKLSANI
jgi:hypothetical protein